MTVMVAVTCDRRPGRAAKEPNAAGRMRPARPEVYVGAHVVASVRGAGAEPVVLPPEPGDLDGVIAWVRDRCDAVVITGGAFDIHPAHYGAEVHARLDRTDTGRTELELALARMCVDADLPLLGVCGGMQALAVALGGTLVQDIATELRDAGEHEQPTDPVEAWHSVTLSPSLLARAYDTQEIQVNSTHHQAVLDPGRCAIVGRAPDGVVEAIELSDHRFCVGVQWHPELIDAAPYRALIEAATAA